MKKVKLYATGIFVVTVLVAIQGLACGCPDLGDPLEIKVRYAVKEADAVFAGEVLSVSDKGSFKSVDLSLITLWKGNDDLADKVAVLTPRNGAACGIDFIVGEKYLVYASFSTENSSEPTLNAWLCSRTRLLSKQRADLPYLGKGKTLKSSTESKP